MVEGWLKASKCLSLSAQERLSQALFQGVKMGASNGPCLVSLLTLSNALLQIEAIQRVTHPPFSGKMQEIETCSKFSVGCCTPQQEAAWVQWLMLEGEFSTSGKGI